ncbi:MAG: radical SAM protein, partial [Candidatus Altiarchaeales archaeon]|nr:radical SAM protein [Candidatus Altiarchaeales archaeon]
MKTASKPTIVGVDTAGKTDLRPKEMAAEKSRVLFGSTMLPLGMIDVASWAKQEGLAEPVVYNIQPGFLFDMGYEFPKHERIKVDYSFRSVREALDSNGISSISCLFTDNGVYPSVKSKISKSDEKTWLFIDEYNHRTYRIVDDGGKFQVFDVKKLDEEGVTADLKKYVEERGLDKSRYFKDDGRLTQEAFTAVSLLGGGFVRKLVGFNPNVVGFSLYAGGMGELKKYVNAVRFFSDAFVVVGGPTPTSHPKEVLEESGADFVFAGEAEETFNSFLRAVGSRNAKSQLTKEDHAKLLEIPGLAFRHGSRIYHNTLPADGYGRTILDVDASIPPEERAMLLNMKRPYASERLLNLNRLDWSLLENYTEANKALVLTGGRGCPGLCVFCSQLHGRMPRQKSVETILREIRNIDEQVSKGNVEPEFKDWFRDVEDPHFKTRQVAILGLLEEDFFLDRARALKFFEVWGSPENTDLRDKYRLQFQTNPASLLGGKKEPDVLFEKLMAYIQEYKPLVELGVETFNPELLKRMHKRHTMKQGELVLDRFDQMRMDYRVNMIMTDYETTPEEYLESLHLMLINSCKRGHMALFTTSYTTPYLSSEVGRNFSILASRDSK